MHAVEAVHVDAFHLFHPRSFALCNRRSDVGTFDGYEAKRDRLRARVDG